MFGVGSGALREQSLSGWAEIVEPVTIAAALAASSVLARTGSHQ